MAVKAPADKRFKRARVKSPKRRAGWSRFVRPIVLLGVTAVIASYASARALALVTHSPALRISRIGVQGARHLTPNEVVARVPELKGQNIVRADLERARARLMRSPWIREATLRRQLPSTIEIAVVEREPIGLARLDERLYLVAADGTLLAEFGPGHEEYDLPIIDGLQVRSAGRLVVDDVRAALAADVVRHLRQTDDLGRLVSQIDVSDDEDAVVLLADDPARLHLGHERFAERLRAYQELAPALRERVAAIDYVDLRFDERVFVRPVRARAR
jgi:cell division protein FtsQ